MVRCTEGWAQFPDADRSSFFFLISFNSLGLFIVTSCLQLYLYLPRTFAQYLYSPPKALQYDLEAHQTVCDGKSNLFFIYSERLSSAYSIMAHSYFTPHHKRWKKCGDEWDMWEYAQDELSGTGAAESFLNKNNANSVEWVILSAVTAYFLLPMVKYDIRQHSLNTKLKALSHESQFVLLQARNKCN